MIFRKLSVRNAKDKRKGVFASEGIRKGEKMLDFHGMIVGEKGAGEWDLQIGKNKFIRTTNGKNQIDNFLNHSCSPNSFVRKSGGKFYLVALKGIQKGEEITFDYDTTDYDNKELSFECKCSAENCRKKIMGFRYLSRRQKKLLEKHALPYMKRIFEKEKA